MSRFLKQWDSGGAVAVASQVLATDDAISFPYDPVTRAIEMPVYEVEAPDA